jgi:hypothetical protein
MWVMAEPFPRAVEELKIFSQQNQFLDSGYSLNKELCGTGIDLEFKSVLHIKYPYSILGVWGLPYMTSSE